MISLWRRWIWLGVLASSLLLGCSGLALTKSAAATSADNEALSLAEGWHHTSLPDLRIIHRLRRDSDVYGVAWSSDSTRLATVSQFGNLVTVWNADGQVLGVIHRPGAGDATNAIAFVGDNDEIASPPDEKSPEMAFLVHDIQTGAIAHRVLGPKPKWHTRANWANVLVSSPDQSLLAVGLRAPSLPVILYSTRDWTKVAEVPNPGPTAPTALAFSPDGRYLAIGMTLDFIIFDVEARKVLRQTKAFSLIAGECCITAISFNPSGSEVAVVASEVGGVCRPVPGGSYCPPPAPGAPIRVFERRDGAVIAFYPAPISWISTAQWSPDGRFVAFVVNNGLHLWSMLEPRERKATEFSVNGACLAFAPNRRWLAACNGQSAEIFEIAD